MSNTDIKNEHAKETLRIEAFSDGVFAIAITLLILDIHVPDVQPNETLLHALSLEWASFLALLIGFLTILICWINHHYMFTMIYQSNSKLMLINGFKLLVVTITPFATALLSKHIQTDWRASAINIYAFNFALMGTAMTCVWYYANTMGFTRAASKEILSATTRLYIFAGTISTLIWIVSFFSIVTSLVLSGFMFMIFIFPEKMVAWQVQKK
jgi:uncharacterized membrane protein